MTQPPTYVHFSSENSVTVGLLQGTEVLDGKNVADFGNEVLAFLKDQQGLNLLLDFQHITFLSSAALTELLRINEAIRALHGSVRLCGLSANIYKVFKITNLAHLFFIHEGEDTPSALRRYERSLSIAADEDAWSAGDAGA